MVNSIQRSSEERTPCNCDGGRVQAVPAGVELSLGDFEAAREGKSCSFGAAANVS